MTTPSDNDDIVALAKETFGGVDVVFLNAGLMPNSPLSALKTDDWHQMVDVNIKGVLNGVAPALPTFMEQKSGQVIANSSVAGLKAFADRVTGTFEEFRPQPEAFIEAEGDNVVVPVNVQGRGKSGRDFTGRALWLYRLSDGKIARAEVFLDTARARDAVG